MRSWSWAGTGGAPDYGAAGKSGAGVSGLHRRVSLIPVSAPGSHRSLTRPILSAGFTLGDAPGSPATEGGLPVPAGGLAEPSWQRVPLVVPGGSTLEELRALSAGICFADSGRRTPSLLQRGVSLRTIASPPGERGRSCFLPPPTAVSGGGSDCFRITGAR